LRLLVQLKACRKFPYDLTYHRNLQGLIYHLIRNSRYASLHDKKGYKYFSFSNIIPPTQEIDQGSSKTLIIASPDENFIKTLSNCLMQPHAREIKIGQMIFKVEAARTAIHDLPRRPFSGFTLSSGTPIVVRIPKSRLQDYGISTKHSYPYVYWRKEHTPTAFIKQLKENLVKKYNEYYNTDLELLQIIDQFQFRKQVAIPLEIKGEETIIVGTLWDFHFTASDDSRRNILQFGLDAGFGEMNSLGFGFMNLRTPST